MSDEFDDRVAEIRQRVIDVEKDDLIKIAQKKFPGDQARQEKYAFKALAAKYDFKKGQKEIDEILNLPQTGVEISFAIGSTSFLEGDCLADIIKRDVGVFGR